MANAFEVRDFQEARRCAREILDKDKNSKEGLLWNVKACNELQLYPEALDMCTQLAALGSIGLVDQMMHGKVIFSRVFVISLVKFVTVSLDLGLQREMERRHRDAHNNY